MSYSSISITAPDSAEEGQRVSVSAKVTNVSGYDLPFRVKLYAVRDIYAVPAPGDLLGTFEETIGSGKSKTYSGSFTMPAWDTIVLVMVYLFINHWDFDVYATKVVSLGAPVPGAYTEITSLIVPQSARPGDTVTITVGVKNLYLAGITITVNGKVGTTAIGFGNLYHVVAPGEIATFTQQFVMSSVGVTIQVWSHYLGADGTWIQDDSAQTTVSISEEPPVEEEVTGVIVKTEIEVNGVQTSPPVPGVEVGEDFRLYVWGKNTSSEGVRMALRYVITKPSGVVIEHRVDELWPYTGPGNTHRFVEDDFDVDESGTWFLQLYLYGDDILLDMAETAMFTVGEAPEPPPEYALIRDHTYPLASTYYGYAERSTVTFSVVAPSFMLSSDKVDQMVTTLEDKFAEEGAHVLELKLYEKRGLVRTDYSASIVTTLPEASGQAVVPTIFGISTTVFIAIIIAVCLIVGLIIILVVRKDVNQFLFGTPPTDEEPGVPGMVDLVGNMVVIMIIIMMMETMGPMLAPEGAPPRPKPVTEAVVKVAKVTGKAVVEAAPVVGKAVIRVAKRF